MLLRILFWQVLPRARKAVTKAAENQVRSTLVALNRGGHVPGAPSS